MEEKYQIAMAAIKQVPMPKQGRPPDVATRVAEALGLTRKVVLSNALHVAGPMEGWCAKYARMRKQA